MLLPPLLSFLLPPLLLLLHINRRK